MIDWNEDFKENITNLHEDLTDQWEDVSCRFAEDYSASELSKKLDILFDTLQDLLYALKLKAEEKK